MMRIAVLGAGGHLTYDPYSMWVVFGFIGIGSMLALIIYNHFVIAAD